MSAPPNRFNLEYLKLIGEYSKEFQRLSQPVADRVLNLIQKGIGVSEAITKALAENNFFGRNQDVLMGVLFRAAAYGYEIEPAKVANPAAVKTKLLYEAWAPDKMNLSVRLHGTSAIMRQEIVDTISTAMRQQKAVKGIAMELYDGYSSGKKVISSAELPQYLDQLQKAARRLAQGDAESLREFNRTLKTAKESIEKLAGHDAPNRALKAAYQKIVDAAEALSEKRLDKAIHVAIEEKSRYLAERIARTEMSAAWGESFIAKNQDDSDVIAYRWVLSSRHLKTDVCCTPGTMISTEKGLMPIEKVSVGDKIYTHTGHLQLVERLYKREIKESQLVRLQFQEEKGRILELTLTQNHPILTERGWIPAGDLQKGCLGFSLPLSQIEPLYRPGDDALHTTLLDFVESEKRELSKTYDAILCDELPSTADHKPHKTLEYSHCTILKSQLASGTFYCQGFRFSKPDCFLRCAIRKVLAGFWHYGETYLDAFSRNWDYLHQNEVHILENNRWRFCDKIQNVFHMFYKLKGLKRVAPDNICSSNIFASYLKQGQETFCHKFGKLPLFVYHDCDILMRIRGCNKGVLRSGKGVLFQMMKGTFLYHKLYKFSIRIISKLINLIYSNMTCSKHPLRLTKKEAFVVKSQIVYNLGVAIDNSYVANGVIVHNCDFYSQSDLYGLGSGVYPKESLPRHPAHPHCMCLLEPVYEGEIHMDFKEEAKQLDGAAFNKAAGDEYLKSLSQFDQKQLLGVEGWMAWQQGKGWQQSLRNWEGPGKPETRFQPDDFEEQPNRIPDKDYNLKIRSQVQKRHIEGTKEYQKYAESLAELGLKPGIMSYPDLQALVDKYHGQGEYESSKGSGIREKIITDQTVGQYWNSKEQKYIDTKAFRIVYSKRGTHIFPIWDGGKE